MPSPKLTPLDEAERAELEAWLAEHAESLPPPVRAALEQHHALCEGLRGSRYRLSQILVELRRALGIIAASERRQSKDTLGPLCNGDRTVDLDTGACLRTLEGHTSGVTSVALHADGRRAVTGSSDNTVRVWDLDTGACLGTWFGADAFHGVDLGKPLTDGRVHIAAGCGNDVLFFELMPPGPPTRTTLATWSPTHPLIASVLDTGAVTLHQWHASSAHLEALVRSAPDSAPISSLRFSLDGTRLQVLSADGTEHILDAFTLQPASPPASAWAPALLDSPDGAWRAVIRDGRLVVEPAKP